MRRRTFTFSHTVQANAESVVLVFAPTRTIIFSATVVRPRAIAAVVQIDDRRIAVQVHVVTPNVTLRPGEVLELELVIAGEDLASPVVIERTAQQGVISGPAYNDLVATINQSEYEARVALAQNDAERRCLFELDRQTNALLLEFNPGVLDVQARMKDVADATSILEDRIEYRWNGAEVAPPASVAAGVTQFSMLFRSAMYTRGVWDDWAAIGLTLERFAAGELADQIVAGSGVHKVTRWVCEPDSWYVFAFAEFGFLSLHFSIDVDMWTGLMPALLRMQRMYLKRFAPKGSVRSYGLPPRPALSSAAQAAIRADYETAWDGSAKDAAAWQSMAHANLNEAAATF